MMMGVLDLVEHTLLEDRGTVDLEQAGLVLVLFVVAHGWSSIAWRVWQLPRQWTVNVASTTP